MTDEEFFFIFERNVTIKAFRPFYRSAEESYHDFAKRVSDRYCTSGSACNSCGSQTRIRTRVAAWELRYQNKETIVTNLIGLAGILFGHVIQTSMRLTFTTSHALCPRCFARTLLRRNLMIVASLFTTVVAVVALIATAATGIFLVVILSTESKVSDTLTVGFIGSLALTSMLFLLKRKMDALEVPAFLRPIAKRPIALRRIE